MVLNADIRNWFFGLLRPIEEMCVRWGITPAHLSFSQLVGSFFVWYFYAVGSFLFGGALLLVIGVFDVLDGRVARATATASDRGAFLDSIIDRYADAFVFLGLIYFFQGTWKIWPALFALVGSLNISYARARAEGLGVECKVGLMQRAERILLLGVGTMLGSLFPEIVTYTIILLAVLVNFTAGQRVVYVWREVDDHLAS